MGDYELTPEELNQLIEMDINEKQRQLDEYNRIHKNCSKTSLCKYKQEIDYNKDGNGFFYNEMIA